MEKDGKKDGKKDGEGEKREILLLIYFFSF